MFAGVGRMLWKNGIFEKKSIFEKKVYIQLVHFNVAVCANSLLKSTQMSTEMYANPAASCEDVSMEDTIREIKEIVAVTTILLIILWGKYCVDQISPA